MKQIIKIPDIKKCHCGLDGKIRTDERGHTLVYRVMCDNLHYVSKYCDTVNRCVHRWNNRIMLANTNN